MRGQHRDSATRNSRTDVVGSARQDNRHACAQNQTRAVCIGKEAQLLGEDVPRLEIGNEENVWITGDLGLDPFDFRRLFADGIVEGERTVQDAAPADPGKDN